MLYIVYGVWTSVLSTTSSNWQICILLSPVRTCPFADSGKIAFWQLLFQSVPLVKTKTYQSSILLPFFHFAIQDKSIPTKVLSLLRPCGCTFNVFYFLSTLPAIFNMHEAKCLHQMYLCMTRTSMSKNDVIENVLRSLAGGEAANRAPSKIPPSTKSCSTLFVDRCGELNRALTANNIPIVQELSE